jgi:hypothetical protein
VTYYPAEVFKYLSLCCRQDKILTARYGFPGTLLPVNMTALNADNSQYRKFNMAVDKQEVLTAQQRDEIIEKLQRPERKLKSAISKAS